MLPSIDIGSVTISTYWLMLCLGAVGMFLCLRSRRSRFDLSGIACILFTVLLTAVGVAGAKLLFVLENLTEALQNGIRAGGFSFYGSVFLIPLLMPPFGRLFKLRAGQSMDICAPCVAIMIGCMRVGCFFQGCCGGWQMCISDFCFTWPTQAIESIGDFTILMFLLQWEKQDRCRAVLYPCFMILYSAMRFLIEFLRDTPKDWLWLSHGQWFAIGAILVGVLWLVMSKGLKNSGDGNESKY